MAYILIILFPFLMAINACDSSPKKSEANGTVAKKVSSDHSFVYKYDGSQQCGMAKGIETAVMAKELKDIKIFSSVNKNDGMMRTQVCGSSTGMANVYEISTQDLEKAKTYGFLEWKN